MLRARRSRSGAKGPSIFADLLLNFTPVERFDFATVHRDRKYGPIRLLEYVVRTTDPYQSPAMPANKTQQLGKADLSWHVPAFRCRGSGVHATASSQPLIVANPGGD